MRQTLNVLIIKTCYSVCCSFCLVIVSVFGLMVTPDPNKISQLSVKHCVSRSMNFRNSRQWSSSQYIIEPRNEILNNVVCATSKASDQPAHTCMRSWPEPLLVA